MTYEKSIGIIRFYGTIFKEEEDVFDDNIIYHYTMQAMNMKNNEVIVFIEELQDWINKDRFRLLENYQPN